MEETPKVSTLQWANSILDELVAPECSTVTSCEAPLIDELPNYFGSFFLNCVFVGKPRERLRGATIVFLRRLTHAVREYRWGRECLIQYVGTLPRTNNETGLYLRALTHFEQCAVNLYLALLAFLAVARILDSKAEKVFSRGDGSPADKLNQLYNRLKHFDESIIDSSFPAAPAPVWIVNNGLKCNVKSSNQIFLAFTEIKELIQELEWNAKFLSEEVYAQARANRSSST